MKPLIKRFIIFSSVVLFLYACNRSAYHTTNKSHKQQAYQLARELVSVPVQQHASLSYAKEWVGTTNFSLRKPNMVIIHHTAQNSCDQTLRTFTLTRTQVSSHYVICADGTIHQMLNDYFRAHHAGVSKWGNMTDLNSGSIGIELDNNGYQAFSERQIESLVALLEQLKKKYQIPTANFIGHGDIAPTRKNDPNWRFPWKQLHEKGFGLWWKDTTGVKVPENFNHLQALRIVGYDIADSSAAKRAFKRHFMQDTTAQFGTSEKKILMQLYTQF